MHRDGEYVVGIDDYGDALLRNRIYVLLRDFVILALGVLLDGARLDDAGGVLARRTVHDRGLGGGDIDYGVIHAERPQSRHYMFYRADLDAVLLDCRTARSVGYKFAQSGYDGRAFEVDAAENDAAVFGSGTNRHSDVKACMQTLAFERDRCGQGSLFSSHTYVKFM